MSRPMIHCPACRRELYQLRRLQCLWCGARLTNAEFQQVALPPGAPLPPSPPMPLTPPLMGTPWFGRGGGLFVRLGMGVAVYVIVTLAHLAERAWHLRQVSHLIPPVH